LKVPTQNKYYKNETAYMGCTQYFKNMATVSVTLSSSASHMYDMAIVFCSIIKVIKW